MVSVSVTSLAWQNIANQWSRTNHKFRRANRLWAGDTYTFVTIQTTPKARGAAEFFLTRLFNQTPHIPNHNYNPNYLEPSTFRDHREHAMSDYEQFGYPGTIPDPKMLIAARHPYNPTYTTWSNGEDRIRHDLLIPKTPALLKAVSAISNYWYLSLTGRAPFTFGEQLSALINALGLGYLQHDYFPVPLLQPPGVTDAVVLPDQKEQTKLEPIHIDPLPAPPKQFRCAHCKKPTNTVLFIPPYYRINMCITCIEKDTSQLSPDKYKVEYRHPIP